MSNVMIYCSISVGVGCKTEEKQRVIDANYDNHCHCHLDGSAYAKDVTND